MTLQKAVRQAIARAPCSERALARQAGIDQSTLLRIRQGKEKASERVARAVARALEQWGASCARGVSQIRAALKSSRENKR